MAPVSTVSRPASSAVRATRQEPAALERGRDSQRVELNRARPMDTFEQSRPLAQRLQAPALQGTRGTEKLFPMPDSGPQPIVDAINKSTQSVDLSVYMMTDQKVIDALKQAAGRGVQVRVMLEPHPVGAKGTNAYDILAADLKSAGVQVEPTPPKFDSNHNVDHAKFLVVDQKETLLGTGNLVRSGLGDNGSTTNRDFWVDDTRKRTAAEAERLFNYDWQRKDTSGLHFQNLVVTPENSNARILSLIDGAKKTLLVYNQEMQDPTVIQHLIDAKKRGVDVQVLAASAHSGGFDPNKAGLDQLRAAGIPANELTKFYLHAKAMVADDHAFIGSQNFSSGGMQNNRELGEIVRNPTMVKQLTTMFQDDFASTTTPAPVPAPAPAPALALAAAA